MPGVAFPPVGPVGYGSPPSSVLCAAKTAALPLSGHFACRSRPDTLPASVCSWCPLRARGRVVAPRPRQGFWSPGPPIRECDKETGGSPKFPSSPYAYMPRSQTPVVSCTLAIARPGLLPSGHWKPSAFPSMLSKDILLSTTIHISGLHHAACILVPSSSVLLLLGVHVEFATDLLARLWSGGT
jgi:hypothetical protein